MDGLVLAGVIGLNQINTRLIDKQGEKGCQQPLSDFLHEMTPNLSKYEKFIDLFPIVLGCIALSLVFHITPNLAWKIVLFNFIFFAIFFGTMKGVVVELYGLRNRSELNGTRGFINKILSSNPLCYQVHVGEKKIKIDNTFLHKVYCLGFPCEYWKTEHMNKQDLLINCFQTFKTDVFYIFVESNETHSTAFIVNYKILETALEKMTTEPLLRIYGMKKSQKEVKLVFDQCCVHVPDDLSKPWFTDLSSSRLLNILSRFEYCKDAVQLKNMNYEDHYEAPEE